MSNVYNSTYIKMYSYYTNVQVYFYEIFYIKYSTKLVLQHFSFFTMFL